MSLPLLCKEFIIDPYQIHLARATGADAVLLIVAILSDRDLQDFLDLSHRLGMTALVEVHTATELDRALSLTDLRLLGINNRNLENFTVDLKTNPAANRVATRTNKKQRNNGSQRIRYVSSDRI